MSQLIYATQGDVGGTVTFTLTDHDSGNPIDLTGLSAAVMKFRAVDTTAILSTIALTVVGADIDGKVKLTWPAGALDVPPGFYEGEIELTYAGGTIQTAYTHPRFFVQDQF